MGYRGYEEVICVNGHYFTENATLSNYHIVVDVSDSNLSAL